MTSVFSTVACGDSLLKKNLSKFVSTKKSVTDRYLFTHWNDIFQSGELFPNMDILITVQIDLDAEHEAMFRREND